MKSAVAFKNGDVNGSCVRMTGVNQLHCTAGSLSGSAVGGRSSPTSSSLPIALQLRR